METILLSIISFLLLAAVAELHLLRGEIRRLPRSGPLRADDKSGQPTINVNVGMGGTAALAPSPGDKQVPAEVPPKAVEPVPEKDAPIVPRMPVTRVSPSGVTILKCTGCGSENSSFRKECFKCGAKLS